MTIVNNSSALSAKFATLAIHASQEPDKETGAVIPPLSLSTTFQQDEVAVHKGYEYSRSGNPTRERFEGAVAALEKAKYGLAFSSGSATTATILTSLPKGSHVITVNDVYGGTYRYFTKVASNFDMEITFVDLADTQKLNDQIRPNTKLLWIETPTNPTLRLVDIAEVSSIAKKHGLTLVVDNTFLSPYFQTPMDLGADIVVHSVSKYINGHCDVIMGVAVLNDESLYNRLRFLQNSIGAVPSPFDCYLAHRGLKTLHLRMEQHQKNAFAVARALEKSSRVERVIYPGLASHPQHELAAKQQRGFGGMVSFVLSGNFENANALLKNLKVFTLAESLGGVESLCELPSMMTHGSVSEEDRAKLGISDTLIRLSVGIEDMDDLVEDLNQALEKAFSKE